MEPVTTSDHQPGPEPIGQRLRRLRLERSLSQRALASPGVSYAYISRIEAGTRQPSVKAVRMLARKLGVSPVYLETGSEVDPAEERELKLAAAELELRLSDDPSGVEQTLTRLVEEALQAGDLGAAARGEAALGFAAFRAGDMPGTIELLERALTRGEPSPSAHPDLYATLGRAYAMRGDAEKAVALFRGCLARLSEEEPENTAAYVRFATYLSYALSDQNDMPGAQAAVRDALTHTSESADPYTRVRVYWAQARLAETQGRALEALDQARRAIALLEATEDTLHLARAHVLAAGILMLPDGDPDQAAGQLARAEELFGPHAAPVDLGQLRTVQARLAAATGSYGEALTLAHRALELLGDADHSNRGHAWWAIGEAEAGEGRIDKASEAFARAAELLEEQGHTRERIETYRAWGRALRAAGREDEALDVLEQAADLAVRAGHGDVRAER
jgi:tetratricopeptide (TPR) repeat protein